MLTDIFWSSMFILTSLIGGSSMQCQRLHPQQYFCSSDIVVGLRFMTKVMYASGQKYIALITHVYRDINKALPRGHSTIVVGMPRDLHFIILEDYIIFGRYEMLQLITDECNGNVLYANTTANFRDLIIYYLSNCDCEWKIGGFLKEKTCYWKYGFMLYERGICKWYKSAEFNKCERERIH